MKLIPFNLERALAGDKVVTRDGRKVTQFKIFDNIASAFKVYAVLGKNVRSWTENGSAWIGIERPCDLFMAPKTVKRWVNFYYHSDPYSYATEDEAKRAASNHALAIAVPVEFEEGYGCE